MSIIIATPKAWAANAYISHFGGEKIKIPLEKLLGNGYKGIIYSFPSYCTTIKINQNTYTLNENQFSFGISKNNTSHWSCALEPPTEFEELVNLSWPLWEEYRKGNKLYNE